MIYQISKLITISVNPLQTLPFKEVILKLQGFLNAEPHRSRDFNFNVFSESLLLCVNFFLVLRKPGIG